MRADLRDRHAYKLCLIRPNPSAIDFDIADYVIDLNFTDPEFVAQAITQLKKFNIEVVGGFPFSDKAVLAGSRLLKRLNVLADSDTLAITALSKWEYRQAENNFSDLFKSQDVFLPKSAKIRTFDELKKFFKTSPKGVVLKPTNEGNNRGVSLVQSSAGLMGAWRDASPWLSDGLIVEQIIPFSPEFSHDGIAHLDFVTKKYSAKGAYPVENGQEVGSGLDRKTVSRIKQTGRLVNTLTGSLVGAFHNEIKIDSNSLQTSVVEPNRRPAGMHIWDLAERVYGVSFYSLLIDSALGRGLPEQLPPPKGTAAIRMLPPPVDGKFCAPRDVAMYFTSELADLSARSGLEFFNFSILKNPGERLERVAKTNADFLGQICCYGPNSAQVQAGLDEFEKIWLKVMYGYVQIAREISI
jgi:hypothetical protein